MSVNYFNKTTGNINNVVPPTPGGGGLKIFQQMEQPTEDGLWIKTDQIADVEFFPMDPGLCATSSNRIIGSITDIETVSASALYGPICEINNILYIQLRVNSSDGTVLCGYDPYKQKFFYPSCFNIYYEIASESKGSRYMAMSAINNKLYLIKSGSAFRDSSLKILEYDPSTDTYVNNIPTGDTYNSGIEDNVACTINGKMYIFGGINSYNVANMYDIGIYDPSDNTMAIASAKMVRHAHADARYVGCNVFAIGEKAYIIGNNDTPSNTMSTINDVYKDINIYDSATDTLVLSPVEACAGYGITAWVDDGKIYMCNGMYTDKGTSSYGYTWIEDCVIWIYDPETDTKSQYKSSYSYIHYKGVIAYKLHDQLLMFGEQLYSSVVGYKSGLNLYTLIGDVSYSYVDLPTLSEKYAIFYGQLGGVSTKIADTSYLNISKIIKPNTTLETVESYSISNGTATRIC